MRLEEMVLVSVDDHVVEPPNMFEGRVEAKHADDAPRMIRKDDGSDVWVYDGNQIPNIALAATAGRPPEEFGTDPRRSGPRRPAGRRACSTTSQRLDAGRRQGSPVAGLRR
jgi:hypothetical protein